MALVGGNPSESFPDFGAIFISNKSTKDECFKMGVFGLPFSFASFVKHVKAGMLLFLFEYEERKLYGVFEATSDGRMNIIPHAYRSSGKPFPAQVRFRVVWRCCPLSENCFRDAIKENYYATNKFSFGLSEEQVHRLVWLFDSCRARVQKSPTVKKMKWNNNTCTNPLLLPSSDPGHCDSVDSETPVEQTEQDLLVLDYIPLPIEEDDCDPVMSVIPFEQTAVSAPGTDSSGGSDSEHHHEAKSLYCDTPRKRQSVFSRLQYGVKAVSQYQGENLHKNGNYDSRAKLVSMSSTFKQESEKKYEAPQSVRAIMNKLKWRHKKWMEDTTPVRKSSVFSRISYLSEVPMPNRVSYASYPEEANETAKMRSNRVHVVDHGDGKNISMTIQVEVLGNSDSSSLVNVKQTSHLLDFNHKRRMLQTPLGSNRMFNNHLPEDQHKKRKLMRSTGIDLSYHTTVA